MKLSRTPSVRPNAFGLGALFAAAFRAEQVRASVSSQPSLDSLGDRVHQRFVMDRAALGFDFEVEARQVLFFVEPDLVFAGKLWNPRVTLSMSLGNR